MHLLRRTVCGLVLIAATTIPATGANEPIPDSPTEIRPLMISMEVPELSLLDGNGDAFDLNAALAAKPTVLIFYRGGW
jgi:hypothetical protein